MFQNHGQSSHQNWCKWPSTSTTRRRCISDGACTLCGGKKTLTLRIYHPAIREVLRIGTMEIKNKATRDIAEFWLFLIEVLTEVKKQPDYQFNPKVWMVDGNNTHLCGINERHMEHKYVYKSDFISMELQKLLHRRRYTLYQSYRKINSSSCAVICEATASPHLVFTVPGIRLKISCMTSNLDFELDVAAFGVLGGLWRLANSDNFNGLLLFFNQSW